MAEFDIRALGQFMRHHEAEFGAWAEFSVFQAYAGVSAELGVLATTHSEPSYHVTDAS